MMTFAATRVPPSSRGDTLRLTPLALQQPPDTSSTARSPSDAAQLECGCVDWFIYDTDEPSTTPSSTTPKAVGPIRNRTDPSQQTPTLEWREDHPSLAGEDKS